LPQTGWNTARQIRLYVGFATHRLITIVMGTIVGIDLGIITETGLVDIRINTDGKNAPSGAFFFGKAGECYALARLSLLLLPTINDPEESVRS